MLRLSPAVMMLFFPMAAQDFPAYRAPRFPGTANPDLNGVWEAVNSANWDLEDHAAGPSPLPALLGAIGAEPAGQSVVVGGTIPYQPWAGQKKKENFKNRFARPTDHISNETTGDPEAKCYLPGVPRATYMPFPFQIVQTPQFILISYEYANAARTIYMKDPGPPPVDSWMGQSVGHWEGDTLVVDATGFNDQSWLDRAGDFHSDALHVVERYTLHGPDTLMYEATIEDKNVFTRPWKISMPIYRRQEKNVQLMEFKCVEFVEELMYGQYRKKAAK